MNSPTAKRPFAAHLHHLALNSSNPVALAQFHARAMGLQLRETADGLLGLAEGRRIFFVEGEPKSLAYAGFAVADQMELVLLETRLTASRWPFEIARDGNVFFEPGAIELSDPDGNHLFFGLPRKAQDEPASRLTTLLMKQARYGRPFFVAVRSITVSQFSKPRTIVLIIIAMRSAIGG